MGLCLYIWKSSNTKLDHSPHRNKNKSKQGIRQLAFLRITLAKPQVNCTGRAKYQYRGMARLPFQELLKHFVVHNQNVIQDISVFFKRKVPSPFFMPNQLCGRGGRYGTLVRQALCTQRTRVRLQMTSDFQILCSKRAMDATASKHNLYL